MLLAPTPTHVFFMCVSAALPAVEVRNRLMERVFNASTNAALQLTGPHPGPLGT